MGPFWKYINILSLILIILLAGYVAYNRSTANQMEIEDPTVMQPTKPAEGLFSKIKQLLFPDKQVVNTPIDNKPLLKQPEPEPIPRLEVPMELQEHLPKIQRQPMVTGPGFVAGTEVMVNMPVVTEKIWQEGHWIGLEVGPLTPALAQANGIPQGIKGVLVDEVTLLAAASGIIAGDVITAINDKATGDLYAFKEA
ncbi:MAG TPA: PDZ domain-containing protein, partial [Nitrospirae bacterium]|nr:PDZ domain-containing protein [Nitrospirota bacterium]